MSIQLVFASILYADNHGDEILNNVPCVPHVGSTVDTKWGVRVVTSLHYDFHLNNGSCRVIAKVDRP